ncbi:DUF502 domain-containing protein [Paracoccaceae bacterium]|nr:DUF502 domain-containing protein [Paracoccaceae bacterium]
MTKFIQKLRRDFLTGLVVLIPIVLTVYLAWSVVSFIDNVIIPLIPPKYNPLEIFQIYIPGLGVILFLIVTTIIGALASGFIGRQAIFISEKIFSRTPIVNTIYNSLKQIIQAIFKTNGTNFKQPCLVEYPRKGIWAVAFISTETKGEISKKIKLGALVTVFLPTTPNPTSGFMLFVPKKSIILLDMTVEEAAKLIISAGLIMPENK